MIILHVKLTIQISMSFLLHFDERFFVSKVFQFFSIEMKYIIQTKFS